MPHENPPTGEIPMIDPEGNTNIPAPRIEPPGVGSARGPGVSLLPGELRLDDDQPSGLEDPLGTEGNPSSLPPSEQTPPAGPITDPEEIILGGVKLTQNELKDLVDRGRDYTQKTQELADQRRALEPIRQLSEYLGSLPPQAQEELLMLANQVDAKYTGRAPVGAGALGAPGGAPGVPAPYVSQPGAPQPGYVNIPQIDEKNLSDEGRELFSYLQATAQQQAAIIAHQAQQLRELTGIVPEIRQGFNELRGDREAMGVAAQIKDAYGVDVAPADLRALSEKHRVPNMRAAWLMENESRIQQGAFVKGREAGKEAAAKPASPSGSASRQISIKANPMASADDLFRAAMQGAELIEAYD